MKIYYSKKKKKYYIITDDLMIKILDQIKKDCKDVGVTTVTQLAAEVMPDRQKRNLVYIRLKKMNDMGLIEIVQKLNVKYIVPKFKEVKLFEYTTLLSIPLIASVYSSIIYLLLNIEPIYKPFLWIVLFLLTIYIIIFFKERDVLTKIEGL